MAEDLLYEALEPLGGQSTRVRFTGIVGRSSVVWDARVMTLQHHCRSLTPQERRAGVRQFLAVGPILEGAASVIVALNLSRIDEPAVLKTIIMLRQWKRLKPGRHEYGEAHRFGASDCA